MAGVSLILLGCHSAPAIADAVSLTPSPVATETMPTAVPATPTGAPLPTRHTATPASQPPSPAPPTVVPTSTPTPSPSATHTPTLTPTPTPIGVCEQRLIGDDLLAIVTQTYGLSRDYAPADLVPLTDYFPVEVTLGYPTEVRQVIIEPLVAMVTDMQAAGLRPFIISGYRSYAAQAIAFNKWQEQYPGHVGIISAQPGHSEHQLGAVIDFGSPELPAIVGDEEIEFHTYFYKTSEGQWLADNAHRYGFTLSYTREAFEQTGFYYEPWHYRYVGIEVATYLHDAGITLTEYQLSAGQPPCIP
jgi:zinc D-Ala-D-Ala carboxypeptidase